ncbi:MAG: phage major capsid protein [Wolbachia sp.]
MRILRDPYTNKPYVGFFVTKRVGGEVVNTSAIKLLKLRVSIKNFYSQTVFLLLYHIFPLQSLDMSHYL